MSKMKFPEGDNGWKCRAKARQPEQKFYRRAGSGSQEGRVF